MAHLLNTFFPNDQSFSFEALRAAGAANIGAADISEVISICSRIPSGNEEQWLHEWKVAADRAAANASVSLAKGNTLDAKFAFLRASNYYRTADFYRRDDPFNDKVSHKLDELSGKTLFEALNLMSFVTTKVKIPYQDTTLPGILMRPDSRDTPRPTIIINGGYDSTKEEVVYSLGASALERDFNVLAFDGPGQGEALRNQRLLFRHDWEKVVTPVMDFLLSQPFVDSSKIVLLGVSFGGYLAARAAAFEHRTAAVILNDGIYDFASAFRKKAPALGEYLIREGWDNLVNFFIHWKKQQDTGMRWASSNGKWVFGVETDVEVFREVRKYTLEGIVEQIKTPTLVLDAEDDHFLKGQPKELYDRLVCKKELGRLSREEGASVHCSIGAGARLNQVIWDWLTGLLLLQWR